MTIGLMTEFCGSLVLICLSTCIIMFSFTFYIDWKEEREERKKIQNKFKNFQNAIKNKNG